MSSFKLNKLGFMVAGAALIALAATQGCSSDDDSQATPSGGTAGVSGKGNGGKGGDSGAGDTSNEGGSANVGNTGNGGDSGSGNVGNTGNTDAGAGGEAGSGNPPGCTDATGCFTCAPTTSLQFENVCVTGGCPDTFTDKLSKIAKVGTL